MEILANCQQRLKRIEFSLGLRMRFLGRAFFRVEPLQFLNLALNTGYICGLYDRHAGTNLKAL
jgi:hypothetical protein